MSHNCRIQHRKIENKPNFQKMQQFRRWKQLWSLHKHMKWHFQKLVIKKKVSFIKLSCIHWYNSCYGNIKCNWMKCNQTEPKPYHVRFYINTVLLQIVKQMERWFLAFEWTLASWLSFYRFALRNRSLLVFHVGPLRWDVKAFFIFSTSQTLSEWFLYYLVISTLPGSIQRVYRHTSSLWDCTQSQQCF